MPATTSMPRTRWIPLSAVLLSAACREAPDDPLAAAIVAALAPQPGERAVVRHDPDGVPGLARAVAQALDDAGVQAELLEYGPVTDFRRRIADADIYVWLPDPPPDGTLPEQRDALGAWLDEGRGRQIHFHWAAGTMDADGLPGEHSPAYDRLYRDALGIDHGALRRRQEAAVELLRSDLVAVTTPAGTDLVFRVGDRPFNLQDGDASPDRMRLARTRIDREIELPAGVVRVAPLEETVSGTMVVPRARFGEAEVEGLVLEFVEGRIVELSADAGELAVREALEASPALNYFRELGIGFNPALTAPPGEPWIPYFGYGAGVVRLSLGNNGELGGSVTGDGVRWLFFPDATVRVGETTIVRDGVLTAPSG